MFRRAALANCAVVKCCADNHDHADRNKSNAGVNGNPSTVDGNSRLGLAQLTQKQAKASHGEPDPKKPSPVRIQVRKVRSCAK